MMQRKNTFNMAFKHSVTEKALMKPTCHKTMKFALYIYVYMWQKAIYYVAMTDVTTSAMISQCLQG